MISMLATHGMSIWSGPAIKAFYFLAASSHVSDVCGPELSFRAASFLARRFKWKMPNFCQVVRSNSNKGRFSAAMLRLFATESADEDPEPRLFGG